MVEGEGHFHKGISNKTFAILDLSRFVVKLGDRRNMVKTKKRMFDCRRDHGKDCLTSEI